MEEERGKRKRRGLARSGKHCGQTLWSHMMKRSDAEDRNMEHEVSKEHYNFSEIAA